MKNPNLIGKLRAQLPAEVQDLLDTLLHLAEQRRVALYLVGGPLRDLLLDRPSLDLDVAVEGDAMAFAHALVDELCRDATKARLGAGASATTPEPRVITHPAFLTATVRIPGPTPRLGFHLDLITARSETYSRPGALPTIEPATIHEDLLRRDFTINALALRLSGPEASAILDPTGGLGDLDAKVIRVLHERSFQDDATRILRAVRYAVRFGFQIEAQTHDLLAEGVRCLQTISAPRIHRELARIALEPERAYMLLRLNDIRALSSIHNSLRFHQRNRVVMDILQTWHAPPATFWVALISPEDVSKARSVASHLALTKSQRMAVEAVPEVRRIATKITISNIRRSRLASLLEPFSVAAVWTVAAASGGIVRDRLLDYVTKAQNEHPILTGDDLLTLGLPRGPQLGEILHRLRGAKLDGEIISRQDEMTYVQRMLTAQSSGGRAPSRSS